MASGVNKIFLLGRIEGRIETGQRDYNGSARFYAVLPVVTTQMNLNFKGHYEYELQSHQVVVWDDLARKCSKQLSDGNFIFAEGKLYNRVWEGDESESHRVVEILGTRIDILS